MIKDLACVVRLPLSFSGLFFLLNKGLSEIIQEKWVEVLLLDRGLVLLDRLDESGSLRKKTMARRFSVKIR